MLGCSSDTVIVLFVSSVSSTVSLQSTVAVAVDWPLYATGPLGLLMTRYTQQQSVSLSQSTHAEVVITWSSTMIGGQYPSQGEELSTHQGLGTPV